MTTPPPTHADRRRHLVRPRLVWAGLAIALLGASVLGFGITVLSLPTSIVGSLLLLAGAAAALAGGVMYDAVPGFAAGREVRQVIEGAVHPGVAPGDMERSDRVVADARAASATARAVLAARPAGHPPLAPVAGWAMVATTALIVLSQPWLVGHTATGHDSSLRDTGLAIVVGLAGLRIAVADGRHPVAGGLALLAGGGLVLGGLLAAHDHRGLAGFEVACGAAVLIAALAALLRPAPEPAAS